MSIEENKAVELNRVFVKDFIDPHKVYSIETSTGEYSIVLHNSAQKNIAGYGSERLVGLCSRKKIFIAYYPYKDSLILLVNDKRIDLRAKDISVNRKILFPFVYRLKVLQNNRILMDFKYIWISFETFPDNGDIFTDIRDFCMSRESIEREYFYLTATLQGKDFLIDSKLQMEMNDFVRRKISE